MYISYRIVYIAYRLPYIPILFLIDYSILLIEGACSEPVYCRLLYSIGVIPIHQPLELLINGIIGVIGDFRRGGRYIRIVHKIAIKNFGKN